MQTYFSLLCLLFKVSFREFLNLIKGLNGHFFSLFYAICSPQPSQTVQNVLNTAFTLLYKSLRTYGKPKIPKIIHYFVRKFRFFREFLEISSIPLAKTGFSAAY